MSKHYQKLVRSYEALDVPVGTSQAVIKKAHRKLIKEWHPDVHPEDPERAADRAKIINVAFSRLKSASADELQAVKVFFSKPGRQAKPRKAASPSRARCAPETGRQPQSKARRQPPAWNLDPILCSLRPSRRGRDVIGQVEISSRESSAGVRWRFVLPTCRSCGGWGADIATELCACRACHGLGYRGLALDGLRSISVCSGCGGRGCTVETLCETCRGEACSTVYAAELRLPPMARQQVRRGRRRPWSSRGWRWGAGGPLYPGPLVNRSVALRCSRRAADHIPTAVCRRSALRRRAGLPTQRLGRLNLSRRCC